MTSEFDQKILEIMGIIENKAEEVAAKTGDKTYTIVEDMVRVLSLTYDTTVDYTSYEQERDEIRSKYDD